MTITKSDLDLILPFLQAEAEGKTIELQWSDKSKWDKIDLSYQVPVWASRMVKSGDIRIKPEPSWLVWMPADIEDLPHKTVIRAPGDAAKGRGIHSWNNDGVSLHGYVAVWSYITYRDLLKCEFSTDHGVTWKRCGIEVTP